MFCTTAHRVVPSTYKVGPLTLINLVYKLPQMLPEVYLLGNSRSYSYGESEVFVMMDFLSLTSGEHNSILNKSVALKATPGQFNSMN